MHLTKSTTMREQMSDTCNADLERYWDAIKNGDLSEIGLITTLIFQPAIDAYEGQESGESEADDERRLFNAGEARAIR